MKYALRLMSLLFALLSYAIGVTAQTSPCLPPTNLSVTNIGTTVATLNWTPANSGSQYYSVQFRPPGTLNWTTVTVQQIPYTLGNLSCGTTYEWQVQAFCLGINGVASPSGYTASSTFSTLACTNVCVAPTGITTTNITTNSASINWAAVTGASSYNVRYRPAGATAYFTLTTTTNSINLGTLTCNTTYEVSVQTVCSSSATSTWSAPVTFVTAPCTINCVAPSGMTVTNITTTNAVLNWTPITTGPYVYDIRFRVVGTTNLISVVNILPPFTLNNLVCNTNYEFQVRTNCGNNNYSAWTAFTPFTTLACATSCLAPTNLTSTNLTLSSAVLSWSAPTPNPTNYNLRYKTSTSTTWTVINNVTSPYQLSNLICSTSYEWQVQTICSNAAGSATLSAWSASAFFATTACPAVCPAPVGLTTTNITANSATLNWQVVPGAPNYTVRRRPLGTTTWSYVNTTTNSILIGNLTCGTTYEWQVRANCSTATNTNTNPYSTTASFTTVACPTTCPAPVQLSATNITTTSAQLNWATTNMPQYRVRYRINVTGSTWTYVVTASTNVVINTLSVNTQYVWQVQSICSNNSSTANVPWSAQSYFTTLSTTSTCPPPSTLNFSSGTTPGSLSVSWPAVPTAVSYTVRYRLINTSAWTQSGTTNTYLLPITNLTPGATYEFQIRTVCATSNGSSVTGVWSGSYFYTMPLLLTVYPNPASETISVSWQDENATLVEIRDVFGVLVQSRRVTSSAEMSVVEFSVSSLKEGWYSVTVYSNGSLMSSRFLKSSW